MAADEGWVLGWTQIIQIHLDPPFCGYSVVTKRHVHRKTTQNMTHMMKPPGLAFSWTFWSTTI